MRNRIALAALAAALLSGCALRRGRVEPARPHRSIPYSRIAVVEFEDRTAYSGTGHTFSLALRKKLAERTNSTDVVVIPRTEIPSLNDPFTTGRMPIRDLVRLRKDYLVDAVIVGAVDGHDPYRPPSVHLSLKLVDTAQGTIPFELSDGWDAADRSVQGAIQAYYERNRGKDDCRFGPDIFLISPRYYLGFVADRVAEQLIAGLPRTS